MSEKLELTDEELLDLLIMGNRVTKALVLLELDKRRPGFLEKVEKLIRERRGNEALSASQA